MKIDILTLFPEMFAPVLGESILGRAQKSGLLEIAAHNIRDYSTSKHRTCDDSPFGGGVGMVMQCQPVLDCLDAVTQQQPVHTIYLSPRGQVLNAKKAQELAQRDRLVLLCGHYEGIDERILTRVDEQISIGDYVLTGGELPAMVLIDALSRFIDGVLGSSESVKDESFSCDLLEYPQYTRPAEYLDMKVPDILLSGHHANIVKWRRQQALRITKQFRPDLLDKAELSKDDLQFLQ